MASRERSGRLFQPRKGGAPGQVHTVLRRMVMGAHRKVAKLQVRITVLESYTVLCILVIQAVVQIRPGNGGSLATCQFAQQSHSEYYGTRSKVRVGSFCIEGIEMFGDRFES